MDYLNQLGPLVLASRLKNLSDKLMQGVSKIYREMDLEFEPRWFPVTYYLYHIGPAKVTQLATALKQTHPAIVQVTNIMQKKGLVKVKKDENDQRKTIILLSAEGNRMARMLEETWDTISMATSKLLSENYVDILDDISLLEDALDEEDIYSRIKREYVIRHLADIRVMEFTPIHADEFKSINMQWLKETVGVTRYDEEFLGSPQTEVMAKGGKIFFAVAGIEVVGTVTMLPLDADNIELTKLGVKKKYRRLGIGRMLVNHAMDYAREMSYKTILLLTHPSLKEAIWLYEELGFEKFAGTHLLADQSGRCSISMKLRLTQ